MPVVAFKKRTEKQQLLCTKCGSVGGAAPCDCGAQHLVYAKAGEIAKELIERGDEVTFFDFAPQTGLYPSCDRW